MEGDTEADYFRHIRREQRLALVEIILDPDHGAPKTLVERASTRKKQAKRDATRAQDSSRAFDEVWCVYDVDKHPKLDEAKDQAQRNGISLAISNPCFELWLVLHFRDQTSHIDGDALIKVCRECMPGYSKRLSSRDYRALSGRYEEALRRATSLDRWHARRATVGSNPSTHVYKLTERIRSIRAAEQQARAAMKP